MLDQRGVGGQGLGGAGVSPTWFGQLEAGSLCPLPWSMELGEQAKTLMDLTNSFSKITRNSYIRIFLGVYSFERQKEKELTR